MNPILLAFAASLVTVASHADAAPGLATSTAPDPGMSACAEAPIRSVGTASFVVVDSDGSREFNFGPEINLVFCRTTSAIMTWIRFAESPESDGQDGPHLDVDVCFLSDGGVFRPMETRANPCPGGKTWGVWWHEGPSRAFSNSASSSPCELRIEVASDRLIGTFSCHGLSDESGTNTIDLRDGRFECAFPAPARDDFAS